MTDLGAPPPVGARDALARSEIARGWESVGPALAAAGAAGLLVWRDPHVPGLWPTCPWLAITGTWCPGCGAMRGVERLVHGDLLAVMDHNLLLLPGLVFVAWRYLEWVSRRHPDRLRIPALPQHQAITIVVGVVVLAFWITRNLPGLSWLGAG